METNKYSLIADASVPAFSMFTMIRQYLSMLMRGCGARLQLIWHRAGYNSMQEFVEEDIVHARLLIRCLLAASAWVFRWHHRELTQFPLRFKALGDSLLQVQLKMTSLNRL